MHIPPKILLVSANICVEPYPVFPLGIACLQSYINKKFGNWEVHTFDFNLGNYEDFEALLKQGQFDYIGVSLRNCDDINFYAQRSFFGHYEKIAESIRRCSQAKFLIGGPCVSVFPAETLEVLQADYAIVGEGEQSLCELICKLETGENVEQVEGLCFRKNGEVVINKREHFLSELVIDFDPELADYYFTQSGVLNIQTKRGCPYNCIYCSYPLIDGKEVRTLDCKMVVENIERLTKEQKIKYIFFTDSVFNISEEYNIELANRIIEKGISVNWGTYFMPKNFKKETLQLYRKAGLTHIEFGSDSFSDTQLENYKKHFRFSDIQASSQMCNELGIFYAHFLILGGVGETDETLDETFRNCQALPNTVFFPFIGMRIYPKTELYNIAVSEKVIDSEPIVKPVYYISKKCDISTIKEKAAQTGRSWVFPDSAKSDAIPKLRARKRVGPLWEHLRN